MMKMTRVEAKTRTLSKKWTFEAARDATPIFGSNFDYIFYIEFQEIFGMFETGEIIGLKFK